jgi:hypothetical protein
MYQKGLRYYFKKTAGAGLRWKIRALFYELKYACQRAWKGYADPDTWDISNEITVTLPVLLKEYRKVHQTLFIDELTGQALSMEETDAIIDQLIFYLENCDEDVIYERIFGISPYDEPTVNKMRWKQVATERQRCKNEAMRLLTKWIWQLWD